MENKLFGIYRAKCLDNNDPTGMNKILVHIYQRDGVLNYNEESHTWCPVLTPYGGLSGMGFFMLPPIHADGYVIFENGNSNFPVWIGTYPFAPLKKINEEASDSVGYPVVETVPSIPAEANNDPTTIILKTQYPSIDNPDTQSDSNSVENLIVINESKMELIHKNQLDYEYEPFGITTSTSSSSYVSLRDGALVLGVRTADGRVHEIIIDDSGITMKSALGDELSVKEGFINIKGSDKCQINIQSLENGSININGLVVKIDGETLVVGPPGEFGAAGVVTSSCICPFTCMPTHIGSTKTIVGG